MDLPNAPITRLERHRFQTTLDGKPVDLYTLRNTRGMEVSLCNYGAKIQQILVPDRHGHLGDVILGYDSIAEVIDGHPSMNAFIGRYANRIAGGRFTLDGETHRLRTNDGPHCLHGGIKGSRFVVFDALRRSDQEVELRYRFADGEEGFPGTLPLTLRYALTDDNALTIEWRATAVDRSTVASFTSHGFFNLTGDPALPVTGHVLQLEASHCLALDATRIPTGALCPVAGTPFDFRHAKAVGQHIDEDDPRLRLGNGYDHYFVLDRASQAGELVRAASVHEPTSGRSLEVWTSEPGLQLFTANSLGADTAQNLGKGQRRFAFRGGLCLEPSRYPDAPNQAQFPSARVAPGETYSGQIVYRFCTMA